MLEAVHTLGLKEITLGPTCWLFAGLHLYTNLAGLERERKLELTLVLESGQEPKPARK